MIHLARALVVTAVTVGGWLLFVRAQERARVAPCRVSYVYDGDTVAMRCGDAEEQTARVMGLDTPETVRAKCPEELAAGKRATERLRALVAGGAPRIHRKGTDKYGRALIRLWVDGRDVAETMVNEGLAVRYGGGRRPDWCAKLAQGEG